MHFTIYYFLGWVFLGWVFLGWVFLGWVFYTDIEKQKNNRLKAVSGARSRNRTGTPVLEATDFKY
jgi:hypothetical protein